MLPKNLAETLLYLTSLLSPLKEDIDFQIYNQCLRVKENATMKLQKEIVNRSFVGSQLSINYRLAKIQQTNNLSRTQLTQTSLVPAIHS